MTRTDLWAAGDPERLAALARQMKAKNLWKNYLSSQEQKFLALALDAGSSTWAAFINGRTQLSVRQQDTSGENAAPTISVSSVDPAMLAMRVRYMLYDILVAAHYDQIIPVDLEEPQPILEAPVQIDEAGRVENDDYDDDEYDDENQPSTAKESEDAKMDVDVDANALPEKLEIDDTDEDDTDTVNIRDLLASYSRMYHTFEADLGIITRYRKLQESDRQIEDEAEGSKTAIEKLASSAQFGAANLSLKHLLGIIDAKRDSTNLTDVELRNLISDVRKNRSKWASEERIGQEELYEAAEKVVQDLRATTEHSTAFLNRVSKREAPNYHLVIKKPMDLNTVMKKLKTLQYMSKKEFVDDLMLIWDNCFTYNSDPKHFLRAHATVMKKKTLALIPLVPDIVIRSRAEVEAEAQAEAQAEAAEQEAAAQGKRGKTSKGTKRRRTGNEDQAEAATDAKNDDAKDGDAKDSDAKDGDSAMAVDEKLPLEESQDGVKTEASTDASIAEGAVLAMESQKPAESSQGSDTAGANTAAEQAEAAEEADSSGDEDGEGGESAAATEQQTFAQDLESLAWSQAFTQKRSDYLMYRYQLFKDRKIQGDAEVHLRGSHAMSRYMEIQLNASKGITESNATMAKLSDEGVILTEYDTSSAMPPMPVSQKTNETLPSLTDLPPSKYLSDGKLSKWVMSNLNETQNIRRVLAKVSVIREMQQNPQAYTPFDIPKYNSIADPEPDIASRLPHAEQMYGPAALAGMRRACAKVAMMVGFESSQVRAADVLTELACDYMEKLGKLFVTCIEDSNSTGTLTDKLLGTMHEMGVNSSNNLLRYMTHDIIRYNRKLTDLKTSVNGMLADLLRPGVESYRDEQFKENSDQFTLGQFSGELGDDYFGFKELGLDKELGVDNFVVPFHLLQQRAKADAETEGSSVLKLDITLPDYPPVTKATYKNLIGLVRPYFEKKFEKHDALVEDDKIPLKNRYVRPRIPVTGKILGKRKPQKLLYVREPKPVPEPEPLPDKAEPLDGGGIDTKADIEFGNLNNSDALDTKNFDDSVNYLFKDDSLPDENLLSSANLDFAADFSMNHDDASLSHDGHLDNALDAFDTIS